VLAQFTAGRPGLDLLAFFGVPTIYIELEGEDEGAGARMLGLVRAFQKISPSFCQRALITEPPTAIGRLMREQHSTDYASAKATKLEWVSAEELPARRGFDATTLDALCKLVSSSLPDKKG